MGIEVRSVGVKYCRLKGGYIPGEVGGRRNGRLHFSFHKLFIVIGQQS